MNSNTRYYVTWNRDKNYRIFDIENQFYTYYTVSRRGNFTEKKGGEEGKSMVAEKTQKHLNIDRQRGINRVQFEAVKLELGVYGTGTKPAIFTEISHAQCLSSYKERQLGA